MDRPIEDLIPFARSPKARFPGDRGRGADMPLDAMPKPSNVISPGVNMPGLEIDRPGPLMPMVPSAPGGLSVQRISSPVWSPQEFPNIPPPPGSGPLAPPPPPVAGASPSPQRSPLLRGIEAVQGGLGRAAAFPFQLAGKLDVAAGTRTPEEAEAAAQKYGGITRDVAQAALVPWSKVAGPLGMGIRALQGGALQAIQTPGDVSDRLRGGAVGAGVGVGGDITAKGLRYVGSAFPHKLFSGKKAGELGNWLRQNVPAWAGFKGNRALYEMAREGGQAKLSDAYEKALMGAVTRIPQGTTVNIAADAAKRAGFTGATPDAVGQVAVDAQKLLGLLPSLKKDQATRRVVMDALHSGLPQGAVPDKAMREYAMGSGFMDYAKKSGLFAKGEAFDASLAQEGLRKVGKETLERRGMSEVRNIIRGPLSAPPIKKGTMSNPAAVLGGIAGALGGGSIAGPVGGAGGAAGMGFLGGQLGKRVPTYRNVPETIPQIGQIRRSLLQALTQQMLQNQRSTGQ